MSRSPFRSAQPVLCALLLAAGVPASAQEGEDGQQPEVARVIFEGVGSVDRRELSESINTEPTRCRSFLVKPLCILTDSDVWEEEHLLEPLEVRRDELRIRVFYFRRGWRETTVTSEVRPHGEKVDVVFTVVEGEPTRVRSVAVRQEQEVLSDRQIAAARLPEKGAPLSLIRLDSASLRLRELLGDDGYLDAVVADTALVDAAARSAAVEVELRPGRRASVGSIVIEGNERVAEEVIRVALDMREGQLLRRSDLLGSQRNLYESNLFRLAQVVVPPQADTAKRIEVVVSEAPLRTITTLAGFNTVDFVQTEARFTDHNFRGGGKLLDATATVGNLLAGQLNGSGIFTDVIPATVSGDEEDAFLRPTWQASLTLSMPGFRSNLANTVSGSVFAHRRTVPGIAVDHGYGASAAYTRKLFPRTPASFNYRFEVTSVEAGDVYYCLNYGVCDPGLIRVLRGDQRLSPAILSAFSEQADNPIVPTRGFRARLDAEHASAATLSDFRYNRVAGEYARYLPLGNARTLAGRVRAGWVGALSGTAAALGLEGEAGVLHPRKRFYAGGARSVRGFGENQLGPRILTVDPAALTDPERGGTCTAASVADGSCDPSGVESSAFEPRSLGGTRLLEANVEYRFPIRVFRALEAAVFVDAGWVAAGGARIESKGKGAVTPGFGIRYNSPVGPVRVDMGLMPTGTDDLPVVTEFLDADGERRIVQLATLKAYDPLEDAGGVRGVLRRLTLHLSIGQAF